MAKPVPQESTISRGLGVGVLDPTGLESAGIGDLSIAVSPSDIDLSDFADLPDTSVATLGEDPDSEIERGLPPLANDETKD